jgi:hypothetical protein
MSSETNSQRACRQQLCSPHTSLKPSHRDRLTPTGYRAPAVIKPGLALRHHYSSRVTHAYPWLRAPIKATPVIVLVPSRAGILCYWHPHQSRFGQSFCARSQLGTGLVLSPKHRGCFEGIRSLGDSRCPTFSDESVDQPNPRNAHPLVVRISWSCRSRWCGPRPPVTTFR